MTLGLMLLAAGTLAGAVVLSVDLARGLRSLPRLRDAERAHGPRVTVILAARDEAADIAATVESVLSQDYPTLDLVAVDDRSVDGTGDILDRLAERHPRLQVLHVHALPDGWLGKNHALQRAADVARGELLLFTDADVVFRPDAVARAVGVMEREGLDHLAVAPWISAGSAAATMTVAEFLAVFHTAFRPWKARDHHSPRHVGIGAFNLVRATSYRAVGGHGALPLRPDEDVRLGRALKRAGHRQAAALGTDVARVEWYPTLGAMGRGLRKNAFAVLDYRLALVAAGTALPVVFIFWPLVALFVTAGPAWWMNAGVLAVGAASVADTARVHGLPAWTGFTFPLAAVFLLWMVWAAALRAVWTGRVEWRGTEYRLDELR